MYFICCHLTMFTAILGLRFFLVALPWVIVRSQWLLHVHGMHYHDTPGTLLLSLPSDGN